MSFPSTYRFADDYTRGEHARMKNEFKQYHDRDTYQNFSQTYNLSSDFDHMLLYSDEVPYFLRFSYYLLASLLLLSFPFRVWCVSLSTKHRVGIQKVFKINQ